jgi:hypothetical protein
MSNTYAQRNACCIQHKASAQSRLRRIPAANVGLRGGYLQEARDLVPVCPNCHGMAHRRTPPLSVNGLKSLLIS